MHAVALTPRCRFLASPTGSAHRAPAKHARRCYMRGVQLRSRAAPPIRSRRLYRSWRWLPVRPAASHAAASG